MTCDDIERCPGCHMPVTMHCEPGCTEECRQCRKVLENNDNDLHGDFDATHWAHRFVTRVKANPSIATDEGAMLAWFAGAIMTGHDVARRTAND